MSFYKDNTGIYRIEALDALPWLIHGFGTRWSNSFGSCGNLATLKQVHSDVCVDAAARAGVLGQGDALLSDAPGMLVAVKTADCLPIVLVDERNRAVAAVHAGWRGTVQEIAPKALARMGDRFGTRPQDVHAALGPAIGGCCFEVGPEVVAEFRRFCPGLPVNGKTRIDLYAVNRRQLEQAGLDPARIHSVNLCTACSGDFHSYRRDREKAGRMLSVVGIR